MAKKIDFTIRAIEALPPSAKDRDEYMDTKAPGLYLRVTKKGVKTFSCVGRPKGSSKPERTTLGRFPAVKPEQARARAFEIAGQQAGGTSPAQAARERRKEMTLEALYEEYLKHLKLKKRRPDDFETHYDLYIRPYFGKRQLSDITARQLEKWHQALPQDILRRREKVAKEREARKEQLRKDIEARQALRRHGPLPKPKPAPERHGTPITGQVTANRAMDYLRAMFNWGTKPVRGYFTGMNPAAGHSRFPSKARERFLLSSELPAFFMALAEEPNEVARDCIEAKLLTGARRANVEAMRWSELHFDTAEWHIPETKNGESQVVPISPEAMEMLSARKKVTTSVFVFPSARSKTGHIVNTAKAWRRILKRAGLSDVRQHDLRRTFGSWQLKTGASLVHIGKTLNHKDPNSTRIYARLDLDPLRESINRATSAMYKAGGLRPAAEIIPLPVKLANKAAKR